MKKVATLEWKQLNQRIVHRNHHEVRLCCVFYKMLRTFFVCFQISIELPVIKYFSHHEKKTKLGRRTPSAEPSEKSDVKSKRRSRSHSRSRSASPGRNRRRRSRSRSPDRRWGRYENQKYFEIILKKHSDSELFPLLNT